jgi:hypothetical protein
LYLYAGDEYGENGQVNDAGARENGGVAERYIGRFGVFGGCGNYGVSTYVDKKGEYVDGC